MGYRVVLFLGGEDTISNLEKVDMDVYWSLCAQFISQKPDIYLRGPL
ncbi:T6SS immunity protein Tdi1 domain-containing protein [Bacillus sp. FJAT-18017]